MHLSIELLLLFASVLFLVSLFVTKASSRFGVPVLLLFLGVGMLFGSDGLGVNFENYKVAQTIGTIALCMILFSGGLDTQYKDIKPVVSQGVVISNIGSVVNRFYHRFFYILCCQLVW